MPALSRSDGRPRVTLRKELERFLRAGHPWIYADALHPIQLTTGTVVDVVDRQGRFLARGLYEADSPIALRVLTLDAAEPVDAALIKRRLREALAARRGAIDERATDAFRWCNGEGDFLPGVVVDRYAHVAVVRLDGSAVRVLRPWLTEALLELGRPLGLESIYERSRGGRGELLAGAQPAERIEVREHGIRFAVDVVHGQKTGSFLDQRENRRAIGPYAADTEVANLYAYTGGFSVHAALAGARRVVSVDIAAAALASAHDNFALNGIDPLAHEFACQDVFAWLQASQVAQRRFGLMIVDPPSFAPSQRARAAALAAYRRLFATALTLIEPGGVLAASSCSSHVDAAAFIELLRDAGVRAARRLRLLELRGQPADHPTPPAFPEGRYLKFALLRAS